MLRSPVLRSLLAAAAILVAGCVQLPPTPQDLQARKFEAPVAGKSVIYLVRDIPDFNDGPATLWLGDDRMITTYPGTYYRWEIDAGTHRIAGFASDSGTITVRAEPGRTYYVQQRVIPFTMFNSPMPPTSNFEFVPETSGRAVVMRAQLVQ
jgi:hypothetical protein